MLTRIRESLGKNKGFTLLELAVVMTIGGLAMVAAARVAKVKVIEAQQEEMRDKRTVITAAIANFRADGRYVNPATGNIEDNPETAEDDRFDEIHYPCPADPTLAPNNANYGVERRLAGNPRTTADISCDSSSGVERIEVGGEVIFVGAVPTTTLGLNHEAGIDPFGNKFTYAISEPAAMSQSLVKYDFAKLPKNIKVRKNDQTPVVGAEQEFALYSHGPDGRGAYAMGGNYNACAGAGLDVKNCKYEEAHQNLEFVSADLQYSDAIGASHMDDTMQFGLNDTDLSGLNGPGGNNGMDGKDGSEFWDRSPTDYNSIYNTNSGNLGIGTSDPQEKLHVNGTARIDDELSVRNDVIVGGPHNNSGRLIVSRTSSKTTPATNIIATGREGGWKYGMGINMYFDGTDWRVGSDGASSGAAGVLGQFGPGRLIFYTIPSRGGNNARTVNINNYISMLIDDEGHVGIGINNPQTKLHVKAESTEDVAALIEGGVEIRSRSVNGTPDLYLYHNGLVASERSLEFTIDADKTGANQEDAEFVFSKRSEAIGDGVELMKIEHTGNTKINGRLSVNQPSSPRADLDVGGPIRIGDTAGDDPECDAVRDGKVRFNKTDQVMEYCDGLEWRIIGQQLKCATAQRVGDRFEGDPTVAQNNDLNVGGTTLRGLSCNGDIGHKMTGCALFDNSGNGKNNILYRNNGCYSDTVGANDILSIRCCNTSGVGGYNAGETPTPPSNPPGSGKECVILKSYWSNTVTDYNGQPPQLVGKEIYQVPENADVWASVGDGGGDNARGCASLSDMEQPVMYTGWGNDYQRWGVYVNKNPNDDACVASTNHATFKLGSNIGDEINTIYGNNPGENLKTRNMMHIVARRVKCNEPYAQGPMPEPNQRAQPDCWGFNTNGNPMRMSRGDTYTRNTSAGCSNQGASETYECKAGGLRLVSSTPGSDNCN